ncbi:hypothetical protein V8C86DRAFT_2571132, partial [Haematococcus lacustris]
MSCLADSLLPPCWLLLYAAAALLGDGDGGDLLASCTHNHKDKVLGHTPQNMVGKSRNSSKLRLMTVVCYPHACHALRKCAREHQTDLDKLSPLLHSCLEYPWAAVGLPSTCG